MKKYELLRSGVGVVVSASVGFVVNNAVNATTPSNLGRFARIGVGIGKLAIGSMFSEIVTKHVTDGMDNMFTEVKKATEVAQAAAAAAASTATPPPK